MNTLNIRTAIGLRIKDLRAQVGKSQDDLAFAIEMSRSYIAEIETGKRNVSAVNVERIAHGLGVSVREFFNSEYFDGLETPVDDNVVDEADAE